MKRPGEPVDWKKVHASPQMKKLLRAWEEPVRQRWRFRSEAIGLFGLSLDEILEAVEAVSRLLRDG